MGHQRVTPTHDIDSDRQSANTASQYQESSFTKLQGVLGNRVGGDRFKADLKRYQQDEGKHTVHPLDAVLNSVSAARPDLNKPLFGGLSRELQGEALPSAHGATPHPIQTGLPDPLKTGIETLSGYSLDDVRVHYNSDKPEQLYAHAYTQGRDIYVASGQEQHLPHEGWHVVQQKQGRVKPTMHTEGVAISESGSLEHEADVMGAKALQMRGSGAFAYPVSTSNLLTAQPDGTIQRVRLTGRTGGVQYDPKKLIELKGEEMKKWQGLPGFESSEDFTWHHVAPQSRIELRSLASNPLLVRLGPSASARIGDPGNDFTDPNTDPTGTLTPYSEKVETSLGKTPGIDPGALTSKLQVLADEQKEDVGKKSLSNPHLWHIPKKVLLDHIDKYPTDAEVTAAQKEKMREIVNKKAVLISYKNYKDTESPDRKEHAVPITALHESEESGIGKEMKKLFHKVIHKRPSFVRGHVLDPFSSKKFGVKSKLVTETIDKFIGQVSKDSELKEIIEKTGTELLYKKGMLAGYNVLSKALRAVVVAPPGSSRSFIGVDHTYFTGENVTINEDAFRQACENVEDLKKDWPNDPKIKNLPIHSLEPEKEDLSVGLLNVPKQTLSEEEWTAIDQETELDRSLEEEMGGEIEASPVLPTSKSGWKNIRKNPPKGDKYPITKAEKSLWKELVDQGKEDELDTLKKKVKARGKITDLETAKKTLVEQLLEEERIKRIEATVQSREQELQDEANIYHLEKFRFDQDERLSKLNGAIEKFNELYSGEAKKIDVNPFSFLMHHWPDMETTLAGLSYRLTYNIAADKEPTSESDFDSYVKNLSGKYDQALKDALLILKKEFVSYARAE